MNHTNSNLSSAEENNSSTKDVISESLASRSGQPESQKIILLPRNAHQEQSLWIGVLAKYFNIWAPTFPVNLKENGTRYTFDFYCEPRSKLIKVFTLEDAKVITSYVDLPYAEHILFILDFQINDCDQRSYCGECGSCQFAYELAEKVDACICFRKDTDINRIEEQDEDGEWEDAELFEH